MTQAEFLETLKNPEIRKEIVDILAEAIHQPLIIEPLTIKKAKKFLNDNGRVAICPPDYFLQVEPTPSEKV